MKNKILNLLLVTAVIFSFSFTATAETTVKTDKFAAIEITQTKASPVAAVASPGDFVGVKAEVKNEISVGVSTINGTTGEIQSSNQRVDMATIYVANDFSTDKYRNLRKLGSIQNLNRLLSWQSETAMQFDYISPPNRTSFVGKILDPDKRLSNYIVGAQLARQFINRI
jgi:hypothetical protein